MNYFLTTFLFLVFAIGHAQEINQFDANGKRHGKWMKTYEGTDQIRYRGTFEHGQEIGTFEFFKLLEEEPKSGVEIHPFATKTYTEGSDLVEIKYFTEKGNLLSTGKMKEKERVGKWIYYHPDTDKVMRTEIYQNGTLNGEQITYFPNGKPTKIANYKNGKLHGITKIFADEGSLLKYFTYENGELNGVTKYFDADGNITATGTYKDNRKDGIWKTYKNGKLVKTEEFPKH
ncbi:MAG TPA: toxin-antitoxin system YwqK family antitoxin [Flavobacteriaceae bacterium]|nr:toxin-antitoxin system YwqK family antitoxin [Flavobacteriaceae bacterium]